MTTPTVSVIIPAYNAAGFVGRTLESLRAQTFADFEAIVVDDGSKDDTARIVQEIVDLDPRFRLIRQANGGVAAARNRAIEEARGRYLANLDSDDMWRPTFLERTLAALEAAGHDAVFAFARTLWIDEHDRLLAQAEQPLPPVVGYRELLIRNLVGNGSAMLMRAAAVRDIGGYDEGLVRTFGQAEDWQLLLQLCWRGRVATVAEPLVLYRILPQSTSHALDRAARAALEVIRRCRANGPPLPRRDYWTARSLTLLWLARRASRMGRRRLALAFAARAYLGNPLWFTLRELRAPIVNLPLRPFGAWRRALPAGGVGAPAA
jgi:glycosyltransferase involved in cell wall biosynthesis